MRSEALRCGLLIAYRAVSAAAACGASGQPGQESTRCQMAEGPAVPARCGPAGCCQAPAGIAGSVGAQPVQRRQAHPQKGLLSCGFPPEAPAERGSLHTGVWGMLGFLCLLGFQGSSPAANFHFTGFTAKSRSPNHPPEQPKPRDCRNLTSEPAEQLQGLGASMNQPGLLGPVRTAAWATC